MKRSVALIFSLFILASIGFCNDKDAAKNAFEAGNAAYKNDNFAEALEHYRNVSEEYYSFELFFNMGNSYYRLDSLGKAILYYERAKEIKSSDEDLQVNLQIASQQIVDKIEPLPSLGVQTFWNRITSSSLLTAYAVASLICLLVAVLCFAGRLFAGSGTTKQFFSFATGLMVLLFICSFSLGMATSNKMEASQEAIVMWDQVEVKTSPTESGENAFTLHEGTKVEIEQSEDAWLEVKLSNGSVGWLSKNAVENI